MDFNKLCLIHKTCLNLDLNSINKINRQADEMYRQRRYRSFTLHTYSEVKKIEILTSIYRDIYSLYPIINVSVIYMF